MSVTHWQLLAEERDRRQRMDENRARASLSYPVANLHCPRFGPHPFSASANPRVTTCEKCGRRSNDPIHNMEQAA
jgi:hypothetical protein